MWQRGHFESSRMTPEGRPVGRVRSAPSRRAGSIWPLAGAAARLAAPAVANHTVSVYAIPRNRNTWLFFNAKADVFVTMLLRAKGGVVLTSPSLSPSAARCVSGALPLAPLCPESHSPHTESPQSVRCAPGPETIDITHTGAARTLPRLYLSLLSCCVRYTSKEGRRRTDPLSTSHTSLATRPTKYWS